MRRPEADINSRSLSRKVLPFPGVSIFLVDNLPSPLGRGCPAKAFSSAVAGRVRGCFLATGNRLPNFAPKLSWVLVHHPVRNAQQPYPPGSEIIFFRGIFAHLGGLRVNPSVQFDRQSVFEAVEINDPVLETTLAAKLGAQLSAPQEIPGRSFGVGLGTAQYANTLGWDMHGPSIAGLRRWGEAVQALREVTPHPSRDGWRRRRLGTPSPSPQGRGQFID